MTRSQPASADTAPPPGSGPSYDEDLAARMILLHLPSITPARLAWLIGDRSPVAVVAELLGTGPLTNRPPPTAKTVDLLGRWRHEAGTIDGRALVDQERCGGSAIITPLDPTWPFAYDIDPPLMVFHRGRADLLQVESGLAVVGTRRCTSVGRKVAYSVGRDLADAGVAVISGLASGIDGAAHRGALDGSGDVIGIVGSGLDVVYPRSNRALWQEVADVGLLISEYPSGTPPARWRFPARNRLISALSVGAIVVESHDRGGALLTAEQSIERGKTVFAVPGSVLSAASAGTNALLVDGAVPVRSGTEAVEYLGLGPGAGDRHGERQSGSVEDGSDWDVDGVDAELVHHIRSESAGGPVHVDTIVLTTGRSILEVLAGCHRLAEAGLIALDGSTVMVL